MVNEIIALVPFSTKNIYCIINIRKIAMYVSRSYQHAVSWSFKTGHSYTLVLLLFVVSCNLKIPQYNSTHPVSQTNTAVNRAPS